MTFDFLADIKYNVFSGRQKEVIKMSPRTGRPKSDNPKNERVTIRLDNDCSKTLNDYCKQEQVEKAEAIRRGINKLKSDIKK